MIELRKLLLKITYFFCGLLPVTDKVVFASNSADKLEGNMKYIYDELKRVNYSGKIVTLLYKSENDFRGKIRYMFQMMVAAAYLATSKYFIVDDYYYPIYVIKPQKGTTIIQVWHACGAFKKFGYSVLDKSFGASKAFAEKVNIHSNYTYALVSSSFIKDKYAEAFHMAEEKIISIGIPRTDLFFNVEAITKVTDQIYQNYPALKNKKVILYAPTFRGNSKFEAKNDGLPDFEEMTKALGQEYVIILKLHPFMSGKYSLSEKVKESIIDLSNYEDINELMLISDLLITDYSSVVFEFSLLERPMIFFAPDVEEYANERDFYYEYKSFVPGKIVDNTQELIEVILAGDYDMDQIKRFKARFFDFEDGQSSKRFVEKLILKENRGSNE